MSHLKLCSAGGLLFLAIAQQSSRTPIQPTSRTVEGISEGLAPPTTLVHHGIPLTVVSVDATPAQNIGLLAVADADNANLGSPNPTAIHARAIADVSTGPSDATGLRVDVSSTTTGSGFPPPIFASATGLDVTVSAQSAPLGSFADATGMKMTVDATAECAFSATGIDLAVTAAGDDADANGLRVSATANGGEAGTSCAGSFIANSSLASPISDAVGVDATAIATPGGFGDCIGVRGSCGNAGGFGVFSNGDFGATGTKAFVQPHPVDPSRVVQFISLEGNESGTYFRGSTRLVNGVAEIPIPEEWRLVSEDEGITVQVTATGSPVQLYVAERSRQRIIVRGDADCTFDYFVNGVRRGFAEYEPYRANDAFRPLVRGVAFGAQFPTALREVLVENGTLNPDFTPNEATATRMGWDLKNASEIPVQERWWIEPAR